MQPKTSLIGFKTETGTVKAVQATHIVAVVPAAGASGMMTVLTNPALAGAKGQPDYFTTTESVGSIADRMATTNAPLVRIPTHNLFDPRHPGTPLRGGDTLVSPNAITSIDFDPSSPTTIHLDNGMGGIGLRTGMTLENLATSLGQAGSYISLPPSSPFPPLDPTTAAKLNGQVNPRHVPQRPPSFP